MPEMAHFDLEAYGLDDEPGSEQDLDARSVEPKVAPVEIIAPNAWYGHAALLRAFAGIDPDRPVRVVVPHGVDYERRGNMMRSREALPVLVYSTEGADQPYQAAGARLVWRVPSPFALVKRLMANAPQARSGTVVFPSHSYVAPTANEPGPVTVCMDYVALAERLLALPDHLQPVTVCLFYVDVLLGRQRPFVERGLRVVTAGHRLDSRFLIRLDRICRAHIHAAGTGVGSHVFYAVHAGCHFSHIKMDITHDGMSAERLREHAGPERFILDALADRTTLEQREFVHPYISADALPTRLALRQLLLAAERLDRFGVSYAPRSEGRRVVVTGPWAAARSPYRRARQCYDGLWPRLTRSA